jgi:hypothetical protein
LAALALGPAPAPAHADDEYADLQVELLGLPVTGDQQTLQVRVTNVSAWWAAPTTLHVETLTPQAPYPADFAVENLDPGQSAEFTYAMGEYCYGQVVKAVVAAASNYAGVPEVNHANNVAEAQVCPTPPSQNINGIIVHPGPRNAGLGGTQRPQPPAGTFTQVEGLSPGTHTVALGVTGSRASQATRTLSGACADVGWSGSVYNYVGWGQVELPNSTPCGAVVLQLAVEFDRGPLDRVPSKVINRAVLVYDEAQGDPVVCGSGGGLTVSCWQSGGRHPEDKPDGCVVVRVAAAGWGSASGVGELPYLPGPRPTVTRLDARQWDVTEPFSWQYDPSNIPLMPDGSRPTPGQGLLLSGGPSINDLTGEDNTVCISQLSNIHLDVTYTVPPNDGGEFVPPR